MAISHQKPVVCSYCMSTVYVTIQGVCIKCAEKLGIARTLEQLDDEFDCNDRAVREWGDD